MEKRCFNCMELLEDGKCPVCGFENDENPPLEETILKERYYIGNIFSKTVDSTVYIAYDNELQKKVFVREFTGEGIAKLSGKKSPTELTQRFLSYAKSTATVALNNILPRTVDTFSEGSAAYLVTEHFEGENLKTLLHSGIKIGSGNALKIADQLLKGLKSIHGSGMIFGSISPETLYVLKNGEVRLFGIAGGFYDFIDDLDIRVQLLNPSYAAPELFDSTAVKGVHCDVYSVAAILYRIFTGSIPAISFLRSGGENLVAPAKINKDIPKNTETALLNALNWQTEKRTATPTEFLSELSAEKVKRKRSFAMLIAGILGFFQTLYDKSASKKKKTDGKTETSGDGNNSKSGLLWLWITLPCLVLVGLIVALVIMFFPSAETNEDTSSAATSSEDMWYYGSGVETPSNSSDYVFGEGSNKKPTSSLQQNASGNTSSNDPNAVECPDLAGYSLEQAKTILTGNRLLLGEVYYEFSNDYPANYVMAQSLKAGRMVQKGSRIDLVVCKGPLSSQPELPEVAGMDMFAAAKKLGEAGFTNLKYEFYLSDDAPGTVTDISFEDEENATVDSAIIITVSGEKITVPNYSGKTVAEAKTASPDVNFIYKSADGSEISSSDAENGGYIVSSQDIGANSLAYKGVKITLTLTAGA